MSCTRVRQAGERGGHDYADPPLTMLVQPKYQMGRDAAPLVFELLKADTPVRPRVKPVRGQLRVRASTVPPRE